MSGAMKGVRVLAIAVMLLSTISSYAKAGEVVLDANESAPFFSSSLPMDGMCGEIIHAVSQAAGIQSHISYKPLQRMIDEDDNNDLGNPLFFMNNQDFTAIIPIAVYHVAVFDFRPNHANGHTVATLENMRSHKVGLLKGTLVNRSAFEKAGITFEESYSQTSLFKKLRKGRLDVVVEVDLVGRKVIKMLFPREAEQFKTLRIPNSSAPIAILLAEKQPDAQLLAAKYRRGLQMIRASGEYEASLKKYYGDKVPEAYYQQLDRFSYLYHGEEK